MLAFVVNKIKRIQFTKIFEEINESEMDLPNLF